MTIPLPLNKQTVTLLLNKMTATSTVTIPTFYHFYPIR